MEEKEWIDYKERTKTKGVYIETALLHSDAFKELLPLASKVLLYCYEKFYRKKEKRIGGRAAYKVINREFVFTYDEAEFRGLSHRQFHRCLEALYSHGFIDVIHPGSARRGDYAKYAISDRWQNFNTVGFEKLAFPRSVHWVNFGKPFPKKEE